MEAIAFLVKRAGASHESRYDQILQKDVQKHIDAGPEEEREGRNQTHKLGGIIPEGIKVLKCTTFSSCTLRLHRARLRFKRKRIRAEKVKNNNSNHQASTHNSEEDMPEMVGSYEKGLNCGNLINLRKEGDDWAGVEGKPG